MIYEGDFVDDEYDGHGKLYDENENYYEGPFKKGCANGKGAQYKKNGDIVFEGNLVNNARDGNGKLYYENGDYYIGPFKNEYRH